MDSRAIARVVLLATRIGASIVLCVLVACGDTPPAIGAYAVRDSQGIRIVENEESAADSLSWSLEAEPALVIGDESRGDDYSFTRIADAARLSDGSIAVAEMLPAELRLFDSSGTFLRSIGRRGQGPGEYRGIRDIALLPGDTIVLLPVYTDDQLHYFTALGNWIRSVAEPAITADSSVMVRGTSVKRFFADGSALTHGSIRGPLRQLDATPTSAPVVEISNAILFRAVPGHAELVRYGTFEMGRQLHYNNPEPRQPGFVIMNTPLLSHTLTAVSDSDLYISPGGQFEIRVFDSAGGLSGIIRKQHAQEAIPASYRDSMWNAQVTMMRNAGEMWLGRMQPPPLPDPAPALDRMVVDSEKNLWVRESRPGSPAAPRWFIFDSTHTLRYSLRMSIDPVQIGSEFVLAIRNDAYGVPRVLLHRLRKRVSF